MSKQTNLPLRAVSDAAALSDEDLRTAMDAITQEMAKRASAKARNRAVMRQLEAAASAEGYSLEEMRAYMLGVPFHAEEAPENDEEIIAETEEDPVDEIPQYSRKGREQKQNLDRAFESMLEREFAATN